MAELTHLSFGFDSEVRGDHRSWVEQVHGSLISEVGATDDLPAKPAQADGVFTRVEQKEIYIFTADCLPVLMASKQATGPIAAVHAGWRGAKAGIVSKALNLFDDAKQVEVILGPCIGPCCFEVKSDFVNDFEAAQGSVAEFLSERQGKHFFDLPQFVIKRELKSISAPAISLKHWRCTVCSIPKLPSFRRNGHTDTRIRAYICKL